MADVVRFSPGDGGVAIESLYRFEDGNAARNPDKVHPEAAEAPDHAQTTLAPCEHLLEPVRARAVAHEDPPGHVVAGRRRGELRGRHTVDHRPRSTICRYRKGEHP